MIRLDAATVLLQWAVGGLLFLWVTTRRREVGIGYGWLLRGVYLVLAVGSVAAGRIGEPVVLRDASAIGVVIATGAALVVSVARRKAGVRGQRERAARVSERVPASATPTQREPEAREFPPVLDFMAPVIGVLGLIAAGLSDASGGMAADGLSVVRTIVGAAFLGAVSDAMLLGHWYLVQPGLGRAPLHELNRWLMILWPVEVGALLLPTGMVSVLSGDIDDGYGGILGWFWVACAVTTLGLSIVTKAALKERAYSAVMAATGLLYLAILTAFGTDLVARAVLAG